MRTGQSGEVPALRGARDEQDGRRHHHGEAEGGIRHFRGTHRRQSGRQRNALLSPGE